MAKKETIIIELDFDTSDFTKDAAKLNKEISELNKQQKQLKKSGEEGSIQYQKNTEALRENKKSLRETNKTIDQLNTANKATAGSNEQLRAQLSVLTKEYNGLSKAERENGARGKELNSQINQTTETLKENEEGVGDNRRSVGDYGKALGDTPFGSFIGGIQSMGKAFLLNPIGLIITAIVAALALLKKSFERNEASSKKTNKAMAAVSGVFNALLAVIEPLANFIVDTLIIAFEHLAEVADAAISIVSDALNSLGFSDAANSVNEWAEATAQASKDAQDLSDAEFELVKSQREVRLIQLESLKDAEKQRQIRDDESLSISERIAANEKLGRILEEQSVKELSIANESLRIAEERIRLEGASTDLLDARADALVEVADIQERITGQQSELLVNINSLLRDQATKRKEAADAAKAAIEKEIASQRQQLEIFVESQGVRVKTLNEQLKISEQVATRELEILQKELDEKLISQQDYELAKLQIQNEQLLKQSEAVVENAQRELDIITKANESKIEANQFLNDELFLQEQERLSKQLDAQLQFEALRLEQGVVSQEEYNDAINSVNEENSIAISDLESEKKEADKEQRIVDIENQREIDILNREDEFQLLQEDLQRQKEEELLNAESTGADKSLIEAKFAKFSTKIDQQQRKAQVGEALQAFDAIAGLAAGNAEAAKAIAIAQSIINGFQGVTAVLAAKSTIPEPAGSILKGVTAAAVGASAIINVNKIRSTPVPKKKAAKGGIFGGRLHSEGGTKGYFDDGTQIEVERGELFAVVNRNSTGMLNDLSNLNEAGGGVSFGRGGTKSFLQDGGVAIDNISGSIDSEIEANLQIISAVESLPAPVVVVQDINEVQGETVAVEQRAIL
jgi:hypothetical protein